MAKKLKTNEKRAIERYCDVDDKKTYLNWCESYKQAGYSLCKGWKTNACRVHNKNYITAVIDAKLAKIAAKYDCSREALVKALMDDVDDPLSLKADKQRAISLIGDFQGYKRENAPNQEREQAIKQRMTAEDIKLAQQSAQLRTEQEARSKLHTV